MILAPMSGVTDDSFRRMILKLGRPDVFWTEFISAAALLTPKGRKYCLDVLKFSPKERPIVAQIFGSDPLQIEKACAVVAELGFDGIDINMGCPDKDIEKQGAGAALIKNPGLAKEIIKAAKRAASAEASASQGRELPVSVKTRIGYDKDEISKWIPALLKENIAALSVHFRTRKEQYSSFAHWELAKKIVKLRDKYSPKTLIIGNGDIKSLEQAKQFAEKYKVDGFMVGRGALTNPWFFAGREPSIAERLEAIVEHAEIFDVKTFDAVKKYFNAYAKGFNGAKELREELMKVKNSAETKKVVEDFSKNVV